jgi:hypothetical protein
VKAKLQRTSLATSRTDPAIVTVSACGQHRIIKAGAIIDHPDAYRLCKAGYAKPADDECLERLAAEGWGPDIFNEKWQAAADLIAEWEKGIKAANTSEPATQETTDDS